MGLIAPDLFDVTLPSTGEVIQLHPFVMKQYKALMIAKEGGDINQAMLNAVDMCIQGSANINAKELPIQDIEYLFIQLYMSSTGNTVIPAKYKCSHMVQKTQDSEPEECGTLVDVDIRLEDAYVPKSELNDTFMINKKVGIKMKMPTLDMMNKHDSKTPDGMLNLVLDCVDYIFTDNEKYTPDELGGEQFAAIMEQVTGKVMGEMAEFVGNIPRPTLVIKCKCPVCGTEEEKVLSGIEDFFA